MGNTKIIALFNNKGGVIKTQQLIIWDGCYRLWVKKP